MNYIWYTLYATWSFRQATRFARNGHSWFDVAKMGKMMIKEIKYKRLNKHK